MALDHGSVAQLGLDLPDERRGDPLFVLVRGRVQVQDLDDLGNLQLVAHLADLVDVVVRFPGLKKREGTLSSLGCKEQVPIN